MKTSRLCAILVIGGIVTVGPGGCGGGGASGLTIQVTPSGSQMVDEGQSINFTATVVGDATNKGVKWTLTGSNCQSSSSNCGTLSNSTTTSVTYKAPSNLSASSTVTLQVTSVASSSTSVNVTITVTLPPAITTTSLPNGTNGTPYNQTVQATGGVPPLTFAVAAGTLPAGLHLNSTGTITGTPTGPTPPNPANFSVMVTDNGSPKLSASQSFSIFVNPPPPLSITTTSLPGGIDGAPYNAAVSASGGVPPLTWGLAVGALPSGLTLNGSTAQISGTPLTAGTSMFTVQVLDSAIPNQTAQQSLSITIQPPPPLRVTTTALPGGMTAAGFTASLQASGGVPPYAWSIPTGLLPAGLSLNAATGAISGLPVLATTANFMVQVQDSESTPMTASQPLSITIAPNSTSSNNNMLLNGTYSFLFHGFSAGAFEEVAGTFAADGIGSISSGIEDINAPNGVTTVATLTGTYSIGSDGRGTVALTATNVHGTTLTATYLLALDSSGGARFTGQDSAGTTGAGILKLVTVPAATVANFSGNYAFGFSGTDSGGKRDVLAGVIHADGASTLSPGTADMNDAGALTQAMNISGSFTAISNNRGTATLTLPGAVSLQYSFYFVSPSELIFLAIDQPPITNPRLSGEMFLQQSTTVFDPTALHGVSVATGTGLNSNASVFAGLLATDGANGATLAVDQNDGGTISSPVTMMGSYSVASNGRVAFTGLGQRVSVAYLTGLNQGVLMGADAAASSGLLEAQASGTSFGNSSFQGGFTLGALDIAESQVLNVIAETNADGAGNLSGTVDESPTGHTDQTLTATYSIASNGRGTLTTNSPPGIPATLVFYVISSSKARAISSTASDAHPEVFFLDH